MTTVVFDLETRKLSDEVGGWSDHCKALMGVSVAVTWNSETQSFRSYQEDDLALLLLELLEADQIVGFNVLAFDYVVLRPYIDQPSATMARALSSFGLQRKVTNWVNEEGQGVLAILAEKTLDLFVLLTRASRRRIGLGNVAQATLRKGKSTTGAQAVAWFREGRIQEVIDYCRQDVELTRDIWQFGLEHGHVWYEKPHGKAGVARALWAPIKEGDHEQ